jgi:hypothetical protein
MGLDDLAVDVDGPFGGQGPQHGHVLAGVPRRPFVGDAHHPLHGDLVGRSDPEDEPAARRRLRGERLPGQGDGMAGVSGDHRRPHLDARHLRGGHRDDGQGVEAIDLGEPGGVEPGVGDPTDLVDGIGQ